MKATHTTTTTARQRGPNYKEVMQLPQALAICDLLLESEVVSEGARGRGKLDPWRADCQAARLLLSGVRAKIKRNGEATNGNSNTRNRQNTAQERG